MIDAKKFISFLKKLNIKYFTGVPDSVLDEFIKEIQNEKTISHEPTNNEGAAIASGAGYYLATSKIPFVYMQNSGLCNATNPILSLIDEKVFSLPQIILVGRRGAPGIKDEPQHAKIGPKTIDILNTLKLKSIDLSKKKTEQKIFNSIKEAIKLARANNKPVFLIINKGFFKKKISKKILKKNENKRIEYIKKIILSKNLKDSVIFSGTGFASRELYYLNELYNIGHGSTFYNIGAMGHVGQIALAFKKFNKNKRTKVVILDGDGSLQMQMGNILNLGKTNFKILHIVFNNHTHESTGGHNLASDVLDFNLLFKSCGYKNSVTVKNLKHFNKEIEKKLKGPKAIIVDIKPGTIKGLPRPSLSPIQLKNLFIKKNIK
jgi:phosphonopyruvate decarboxylase